MSKRIIIAACAMLCILCMCSCRNVSSEIIQENDRNYSTKDSPVSYDGKYKLSVEFEENEKFVKIYSNDGNETLFYTADDDSGYPTDIGYPIDVYWGKNNYDFFILSSDMGVCLFKYENNSWTDKYFLRIDKSSDNITGASLYFDGHTETYDITNIPEKITEYYMR